MKIIYPDNPHYEEARVGRVFNRRRPERFPNAIVYAENEADVVAAVNLARERGWKIAMRSGGHSWAAWSVREEGLLLDLSLMREMQLDTETNIVRVSPAIKGGAELNPYLAEHGLMFHGGHCPTVGLGGFLLQGGMGWNCRGWGWAAEAIEAIDVVTADGRLVRADATQNNDLFWAARGSGPGFFGVVTRFHLKVRPHPKALTESVYVFPKECYEAVLHWMHSLHTSIATTVETVTLGVTPPGAHEPHIVVLALALVDTHEEAVAALAPFESCPVLAKALVHVFAQPTTFAAQLAKQVEQNPEGYRYAADNAWLQGEADEVVPRMRDAFVALPNATSYTLWYSMGPTRPLPDMALSLQSDIYFATYVNWLEETDDAKHRSWLTERMKALEPVTLGQYLGDSDFGTRTVKFLSDENYGRLETLREKYDPHRLFHSYFTQPGATLNKNHWE
jgi:FAD/FMN-containing dehydrogenase